MSSSEDPNNNNNNNNNNQKNTFPFPREHSFPPFFTPQTNLTTLFAQQTKWSSLILSYSRHHRLFKLSISDALSSSSSSSSNNTTDGQTSSQSTTTTTTTQTSSSSSSSSSPYYNLFTNPQINRRLSPAHLRSLIDFLRRDNRAEYVDPKNQDVVFIYWRTPEEWAQQIERWVDETAQKNTVLTVYELLEGENARGSEFYGMDRDVFLKALNVLVKRGKAQIFGHEDSLGVKFF